MVVAPSESIRAEGGGEEDGESKNLLSALGSFHSRFYFDSEYRHLVDVSNRSTIITHHVVCCSHIFGWPCFCIFKSQL